MGVKMSRKRHSPEQIIRKLREAEVLLAKGETVGAVARQLEVTEQTYYRWRREYGGLRIDQVKRLKKLEKENILIKSPPIKAIYDGPFTIPLFRRNEAMFLVEWN